MKLYQSVTVQDFFVLKGAALLGGVNALHTAFPEDAIEEYKVQGMYTCILISFNILICSSIIVYISK